MQVRLTVETLLPQWWAFQKFQVIEGQNVHDQIVNDTRSMVHDYTLHSFLVVVKKNARYTYAPCMGNSNLGIMTDGCSGGPQ